MNQRFNVYPEGTERMMQLAVQLPPMLKASRPDSDYQPFPSMALHLYAFNDELYEAPAARAFVDLTLNVGNIVNLLRNHYSARTVTPHFDYFAVNWNFMLKLFEHDVPVYRVDDAAKTYPPMGKDLLHVPSTHVLDYVYSLGGIHFRISGDVKRNEIVAVVHNPEYPLLDDSKVFPVTHGLTVKHDYYLSWEKAVATVAEQQASHKPVSFSMGAIIDKFSGSTGEVATYTLPIELLNLPASQEEPPASEPEPVQEIKLAALTMPGKVGKRVQELFNSMMADGSKVQVEGIHYDGNKLNLTYSLV
jgi:hypothetical protein